MRDAIADLDCHKLCRGHFAFADCPRVAEHYARADEVLAGLEKELAQALADMNVWEAAARAETTDELAAAIVEALGKP